MRRITIIAAVLVTACNNQSARLTNTEVENQLLRARLTVLEDRLTRLEDRQPINYAFLKTNSKNWVWLANGGYTLRVGLEKTTKAGNGSRVSLTVQNPLSVHLRGCTARLLWGETNSQGNPVEASKHQKEFDLPNGFDSGTYSFPEFDLGDIPPDKLGFVTVQSIDCERTQATS